MNFKICSETKRDKESERERDSVSCYNFFHSVNLRECKRILMDPAHEII